MSIDHELLGYFVAATIALGFGGPIIALMIYNLRELREIRRKKRLSSHK